MESRTKRNKKSTKVVQGKNQNTSKRISKKTQDTKKKRASKKKKTTRSEAKLAGLEKRFFSKAKQVQHDLDYINQIDDPKVLEWMNNFMEEWVGARLNHPGKKFHKSKIDRKKIWDANNARNRDVMSIHTKVGVNVPEFVFDLIEQVETESPEDAIIDMIDSKKNKS